MVTRAYQFRIYPSEEQQILILKTIGCSRFIYNQMLAKKKQNISLSKFDLNKEIPSFCEEYSFLSEVDSMSLRNSVTDLCTSFDRYQKGLGGMPKFKKRGMKDSYRTNLITSTYKGKVYENIKIDFEKRTITLPKLKEVSFRGYRHLKGLNGRIINATIKHIANKYYVFLCVEENIVLPEKRCENIVGIDVGVKNLVVTSDNEFYGNPDYLKKYERKIKGLQKGLSRKQKGSKNYQKMKMKLAEVYRKLKNARKKKVEEIVNKITKTHDVIIAEKLKVKEMLNKKKNTKNLRKEITNATFSLILNHLKVKSLWQNKTFYQIDTYYPSSRICSQCGNIDNSMKDLSKRVYKCSKCGIEIDRDLNASINIKNEGMRKYLREV